MKNTGKCPKCGGEKIVRFNNYWSGGSQRQGVHVRTGFMSGAELRLYVCSTCGYCETWIDKEDLSKISSRIC